MPDRASGILLHVTSLPSDFGIGDFGPGAFRFADFLKTSGQRYWQILPLNPTEVAGGNSPYHSSSAFAFNPLMISPELLLADGLLVREDLASIPSLPKGRCDYAKVAGFKEKLLSKAADRFFRNASRPGFVDFCERNALWLDDFALFAALKEKFKGRAWNDWPAGVRDRLPGDLAAARRRLSDEVASARFRQFMCSRQWQRLRDYCRSLGVGIIGDLPLYVCYDSTDVWAHPDLFMLGTDKRPAFVAGVPPDCFSATGQLWGNPTYRWDVMAASGFEWWEQRFDCSFKYFDLLRIDHFRGLVGYWEVPAAAPTAATGAWQRAPAVELFTQLGRRFASLPVIAEDLGIITPDVKEVRDRFGFPGMKILLFAFGEQNPKHPYLPHNYEENCVVYTGTHDNNTVRGWFDEEAGDAEKQRLFDYLGVHVAREEIAWALVKMALGSRANLAILPMQDILGLGGEARFNIPSRAFGNWEWRMLAEQLEKAPAQALADLVTCSARALPGAS